MEARGTLGVRMRNTQRIIVPIFLSCARIAAGGGVFYGTQTPSPQMPLLQKMVYHRSAQSPSPAVLHADTLPQGQQDFEPQAMVGKTEELETMGRSG